MVSLTKRPRNKNKPWSVQWYDGGGKRREAAFRTNREAKDFKIKLEHDQREGIPVAARPEAEPPSGRRYGPAVLPGHGAPGGVDPVGQVPLAAAGPPGDPPGDASPGAYPQLLLRGLLASVLTGMDGLPCGLYVVCGGRERGSLRRARNGR